LFLFQKWQGSWKKLSKQSVYENEVDWNKMLKLEKYAVEVVIKNLVFLKKL
jgi:hypothetical protein